MPICSGNTHNSISLSNLSESKSGHRPAWAAGVRSRIISPLARGGRNSTGPFAIGIAIVRIGANFRSIPAGSRQAKKVLVLDTSMVCTSGEVTDQQSNTSSSQVASIKRRDLAGVDGYRIRVARAEELR